MSNDNNKNILVLGAGELGLPVLQSLSNHIPLPSHTLTALLRPSTISSPSPTKASLLRTLRTLSIHLLPFDLHISTPASLAALIRSGPYTTIISCTGFSSPPGTQLKIARAVLEAGGGVVEHFYPWQFGVDYDVIGPEAAGGLFAEQVDVRRLLRGQGGEKVRWTIVSTGMFVSFLVEGEGFGVVEGLNLKVGEYGARGDGMVTVRALGSWENRVTVTTPGDIGRVVARLVLEEGNRRDGVVYTAGDTVSYWELAGLVEEVVGEGRVRREVWGLDFLRGELEKEPGDLLRKYRLLFAEGRGVSWEKEKTVNWEWGMEMIDVKGFLVERLNGES
ncbi:MAG: hypothetical protein Q9208_005461 [Pyrenodesmia sp. 3 TL-2023]